MLKKSVVLCSKQGIDKALRDFVKLQGFSFLLPKLPNQCAVTAEDLHRGLQGNIAERTLFRESWAEVKIQSRQPPDARATKQQNIPN